MIGDLLDLSGQHATKLKGSKQAGRHTTTGASLGPFRLINNGKLKLGGQQQKYANHLEL